MKVRITNPGDKGYKTEVRKADTGELLDLHIVKVSIEVFDNIPHAILTSILPEIDIIADAEIRKVCPCCGKPIEDTSLQGPEQVE